MIPDSSFILLFLSKSVTQGSSFLMKLCSLSYSSNENRFVIAFVSWSIVIFLLFIYLFILSISSRHKVQFLSLECLSARRERKDSLCSCPLRVRSPIASIGVLSNNYFTLLFRSFARCAVVNVALSYMDITFDTPQTRSMSRLTTLERTFGVVDN